MWPYLVCFGLTGLIAYYNEKENQKEDRNPWISALFVILIPAILAGLRDYSIGTDTKNVIKSATNLAVNINSFKSFILFTQNNALFERFDVGYSVFVFILAKIFHNPQITMFIISLLTGLFVYLSLYKMRNECSILMGELVFLFTQYNASYNMIRQSLAMAMGLWALSIVLNEDERRYLKAIIIIVIAMLLHSSAFLSFIPIILYAFYNDYRRTSLFKNATFILVLVIVITSITSIVSFLIEHGILNERYSHYFTEGQISANFSALGVLIYFLPFIFFACGIPLMQTNKKFFIAISIVEIACFTLTNISFYLYRVASYLMFVRILSLSQHDMYTVPPRSKAKIPLQWGLWVGVFLSLIIYFAYFIGYCNLHETYPFIFMK
jgi:uncharacterized membrane protein YqjE